MVVAAGFGRPLSHPAPGNSDGSFHLLQQAAADTAHSHCQLLGPTPQLLCCHQEATYDEDGAVCLCHATRKQPTRRIGFPPSANSGNQTRTRTGLPPSEAGKDADRVAHLRRRQQQQPLRCDGRWAQSSPARFLE